MSDMNPFYIHDIWVEIFKNLPVKTLGQCRCVCKSWHSVISSPSFMAAHLKYYTQNEANSQLLYRHYSGALTEQYTFYFDEAEEKEDNILKLCHKVDCPFNLHEDNPYFRFVGTVYGLICLSDDLFTCTNRVFVWNPLLQKFIRLPPSNSISHEADEYRSVLGFGYDARKNDHRVVKITYRCGKGSNKALSVVEIYSVQERTWKSISAEFLTDYYIPDVWWKSCFSNGTIHWAACDSKAATGSSSSNCLLLFDVQEEKFQRLELPEAITRVRTVALRLLEYRNKLTVLCCERSFIDEIQRCELWVMEEDNAGSSWCRIVNIALDPSIGCGMEPYLRKNGDILGFYKLLDLVAYDPKTKEAKVLGLDKWLCSYFSAYTESLILLDKQDDIGAHDEADIENSSTLGC